MPRSWLDFWNSAHRIYVSDRHRDVHYARIAENFIAQIPRADAVVLDWGCGDASAAPRIAARCGRLLLVDAATATRERLAERHRGSETILVPAPEDLRPAWDGRVDLIVINSVLQYLTPEEADGLLAEAHALLAPGGRLVIADVIPPGDDIVADVGNLLGMALRHGFLLAAVAGLAATFFSPYRQLRNTVGLSRYTEGTMLGKLVQAGFTAERLTPNFGFDQRRMAFSARKS